MSDNGKTEISNWAAWIQQLDAGYSVARAPIPRAQPGEVVIRNHAVAINAFDSKLLKQIWTPENMPQLIVNGCDSAGEVYEVGAGVTHVMKGDRVLALHHRWYPSKSKQRFNGAFQLYACTDALVVQKIPDSLSYTKAATLPLALSTAAVALYSKDTLSLPYPSPLLKLKPIGTRESILIWGGSSSVGACAIQLAVASGLKVVTTASAHNLLNLKALGAHEAFDYKSPDVTQKILAALEGTTYLGVADCISNSSSVAGWTPIFRALGGRRATVTPTARNIPKEAKGGFSFGMLVASKERDVGRAVWRQWVSEALKNGVLRAKPDAVVVGKGLKAVQRAADRHKRGVSYQKIVVDLSREHRRVVRL